MKYICAWCQCEIRSPDGKDNHLTSHGICKKCKRIILFKQSKGGNNGVSKFIDKK